NSKGSKTVAKSTAKKPAASPTKASASKPTTTAAKNNTKATPKRRVVRRPVRRAPVFSTEDREAAMNWIQENMAPQQEPFEHVRGLVPSFELLYQASRSKKAVHVLQYGDSHTAGDDLPNTLREQFQARFGNGGPGFSLAGRPFRGYRRYDV